MGQYRHRISGEEQLIRSMLFSERQLLERLDYDLMFHWFVGLSMDDRVWNHSVFSKNRDRLMRDNIDELFFDAIKKQASDVPRSLLRRRNPAGGLCVDEVI